MSKKQNSSLPAPANLAKMSKETTRTISLRVKESVADQFSAWAAEYETTTSALINQLLESYIAEFGNGENYNAKNR